MKIYRLLFFLFFIVSGIYYWTLPVILEKRAPLSVVDLPQPTPDQLWEQQHSKHLSSEPINQSHPSKSSSVVPNALAKQERDFQEGKSVQFADEDEVPPIDPNNPYPDNEPIATESINSDFEVVPTALLESERQWLITKDEINRQHQDVSIPGQSEVLQPDEPPQDSAEIDIKNPI